MNQRIFLAVAQLAPSCLIFGVTWFTADLVALLMAIFDCSTAIVLGDDSGAGEDSMS